MDAPITQLTTQRLNKETIQMESVLNGIMEYSERKKYGPAVPNTSVDTLGWPSARREATAG